jgi:hypothetical protein
MKGIERISKVNVRRRFGLAPAGRRRERLRGKAAVLGDQGDAAGLGRTRARLGLPFMGARGARLPRDGGGAGLLLPGPDGLWRAGRSGSGRATGSTQSGRIGFFLNLFLMLKQIPEKSRNC